MAETFLCPVWHEQNVTTIVFFLFVTLVNKHNLSHIALAMYIKNVQLYKQQARNIIQSIIHLSLKYGYKCSHRALDK